MSVVALLVRHTEGVGRYPYFAWELCNGGGGGDMLGIESKNGVDFRTLTAVQRRQEGHQGGSEVGNLFITMGGNSALM